MDIIGYRQTYALAAIRSIALNPISVDKGEGSYDIKHMFWLIFFIYIVSMEVRDVDRVV